MNRYGTQLMEQWQAADPQFVTSLPDPRAHFEQMGRQVEEEILEILPSLEGTDTPGETYLQKVGRLQAARTQAEEMILSEYQPPSDSPEPDEPEDWDSMTHPQQEAWIMENTHPGEGREQMLCDLQARIATRAALHSTMGDPALLSED